MIGFDSEAAVGYSNDLKVDQKAAQPPSIHCSRYKVILARAWKSISEFVCQRLPRERLTQSI